MKVGKTKVTKATSKTITGTHRMYIKSETHVKGTKTGRLYQKRTQSQRTKGRYLGGHSTDSASGGIKTNGYYSQKTTHSVNVPKAASAGAIVAGVAGYQVYKRRNAKLSNRTANPTQVRSGSRVGRR